MNTQSISGVAEFFILSKEGKIFRVWSETTYTLHADNVKSTVQKWIKYYLHMKDIVLYFYRT